MRIYYDINARNIVIEGSERFFGSGSLEAVADGLTDIFVRYKESIAKEIQVPFSEIQKQDGSPAGATQSEVLNYLNDEFIKGIVKGTASFSLLQTSKVVSDSRVKIGDFISITPQGTTLNENVWTETITTDGQFTVRRKVQDVIIGLTSGLSFGWFRIQ
jgi:hypothetical protein